MEESPVSHAQLSLLTDVSGIVGVSCVFPLDLVKTRLQSQKGVSKYTGILDCFHKTIAQAGPTRFQQFRSLYQGASVNILLITPEKAIKLVANDGMSGILHTYPCFQFSAMLSKKRMNHSQAVGNHCVWQVTASFKRDSGWCLCWILSNSDNNTNGTSQNSYAAGHTTCECKKTRLRFVYLVLPYRKFLDFLKTDGLRGLYKGLRPTMARDVTFSAIYFPLFAELDSWGPRKKDNSGMFLLFPTRVFVFRRCRFLGKFSRRIVSRCYCFIFCHPTRCHQNPTSVRHSHW